MDWLISYAKSMQKLVTLLLLTSYEEREWENVSLKKLKTQKGKMSMFIWMHMEISIVWMFGWVKKIFIIQYLSLKSESDYYILQFGVAKW